MSTATVIAIAVMVLLLVGMLIIKKTMAASPMLQPILFVCVAIELGLVGFVVWNQFFHKGDSDRLTNAMKKEYVKGTGIGKFLKEKAGGRKVVIISASGVKESKTYQEFVRGIKEAYGDVTEAETKKKDGDGGDGNDAITLDDIKEVVAANSSADIFIFNETLPRDYQDLDTKASFFVWGGSAENPAQIRADIEGGKIIGVLFAIPGDKSGVKPNDPVEKDPDEAFKKRYVIVDKSNLKDNGGYLPVEKQ